MTRRRFFLLSAAAAVLGAARVVVADRVRVVRGLFPGRVRPLDEAGMRTPARWLG